jgi:hypothetical protein
MRSRPDSNLPERLKKTVRAATAALVCSAAPLAASSGLRAAEPSPVWKDGWTINIPGRSSWIADGAPSPFDFRGAPPPSSYFTPGSAKDPYGFADYSIGRTLGIAREYGLGNVQATLGVRMSEPLASNGFTPMLDPRRYLGVGPRVGFEGNKPLQSSWVVEWRVGVSMLNNDRTFDTAGAVANPVLPSYTSGGSLLNLDGLLGLSYWFDAASKLTVGYRADYFKGAAALPISGTAAESSERIDHGPMVRFSIQK